MTISRFRRRHLLPLLLLAGVFVLVLIGAAAVSAGYAEPDGVEPVSSEGQLSTGMVGTRTWTLSGYESTDGYCLTVRISGGQAGGGCGFGLETRQADVGGLRFISMDDDAQLIVGLARAGTASVEALSETSEVFSTIGLSPVVSNGTPFVAFVIPIPTDYQGPVTLRAITASGEAVTSTELQYPLSR